MAEKKASHSTRNKVLAGVGMATLAAAAAGVVFLYGTETGKKKRKEVKSWALRMKADVIDKMEKMKDWNEDTYHQIVNTVAEKYQKVKDVPSEEISALVKDLRSHWKTLKKHVEGAATGKKKSAGKSKAKKTSPKAKPAAASEQATA